MNTLHTTGMTRGQSHTCEAPAGLTTSGRVLLLTFTPLALPRKRCLFHASVFKYYEKSFSQPYC